MPLGLAKVNLKCDICKLEIKQDPPPPFQYSHSISKISFCLKIYIFFHRWSQTFLLLINERGTRAYHCCAGKGRHGRGSCPSTATNERLCAGQNCEHSVTYCLCGWTIRLWPECCSVLKFISIHSFHCYGCQFIWAGFWRAIVGFGIFYLFSQEKVMPYQHWFSRTPRFRKWFIMRQEYCCLRRKPLWLTEITAKVWGSLQTQEEYFHSWVRGIKNQLLSQLKGKAASSRTLM